MSTANPSSTKALAMQAVHQLYLLHRCAAFEALVTYPGGLQFGGGVNPSNAFKYLDAGASHVIVTSYIFRDGQLDPARLKEMVRLRSTPPRGDTLVASGAPWVFGMHSWLHVCLVCLCSPSGRLQ